MPLARRTAALVPPLLLLTMASGTASAALWKDVTAAALGPGTGDWTNKVELADVDGDGRVDLLFANGGEYSTPGPVTRCGVWLNRGNGSDGTPRFEDVSATVLADVTGLSRVIKAGDVDGDGAIDLVVGGSYESRTRLLLGAADGTFTDASDRLPAIDASVGDLELGDVDGDGDLDLVLADWGLDDGAGMLLDPFTAPGGRTMLWTNEGERFVDATAAAMPDVQVAWSWELELVDLEGDFDLDVLVACKACSGSFAFVNDGGRFRHAADAMPQFGNNYDFEPLFLVLPGEREPALAVVTINDGAQDDPANEFDLREHIFVADAAGKLVDRTGTLWLDEHNVGEDDNMVAVLDADSDGDADFLVGALGEGDDRLLLNELATKGTFVLSSNVGIETGLSGTPGTLGIMTADLDGDARPDVVQSQGELADPEAIFLGDEVAKDTAAPIVHAVDPLADGRVRARVHDHRSPSRPHDYRAVELRWTLAAGTAEPVALHWTGEMTFAATVDAVPEQAIGYRVCAVDAAGNEACSAELALGDDEKTDDLDAEGDDAGAQGCAVGPRTPASLLALVVLACVRRRRA